MDIAIHSLESEIPFDIKFETKTEDFAFIDDEITEVLEQIIEAFDMTPADDIDYPEVFSRQREFLNSDDPIDQSRRIADATRILRNFPEIDPNSIDISIDEKNKLKLKFNLKTGLSYA